MEIAHQAGEALAIAGFDRRFLFGKVGMQPVAAALRQPPHAAQQPSFDDASRAVDHRRLFGRRFRDEPASTRADMNDAACLEAHHRFAHTSPRHAEERGQLVLAEPCAGLYAAREDAGDDGLLDRIMERRCCSILHTRQECKACASLIYPRLQRLAGDPFSSFAYPDAVSSLSGHRFSGSRYRRATHVRSERAFSSALAATHRILRSKPTGHESRAKTGHRRHTAHPDLCTA
ncbi:hypothetical protein D9M68_704570 [compost metagenome]